MKGKNKFMRKCIKILELFGEPFAVGGEETIVYNIFKNMDKRYIHIDFLAQYSGKNEEMRNSIEKTGYKFYSFKEQKDNYFGRLKYFHEVKEFLKKNNYDIIHIHSGSILGFILGIMATKNNKRYIIVHSHNTGIINFKKKLVKIIFAPILLKADMYLGCTKEAIEFKFPKKIVKNGKYEIIKNGIDFKEFLYNAEVRKKYRNMLNIENGTIALGFIGRLVEQKNPLFLINILENLIKKSENIKLYIVGEGELKENFIDLLKQKGLEKYTIMLGKRNDVNNIMQALDVLLFPSLFEGLGIVAIEAQAASLPVLVSTGVPEEANISEFFYRIKDYNADAWAEEILRVAKKIKRRNTEQEIVSSGYDIKNTAKKIRNIYIEGAEYGKNKRK